MALKVIGAGLGRTGTMSLKFALEHIGFGPCYHMIEFRAQVPSSLEKWQSVLDGKPDWNAVFDGYTSSVDYPGCTYWREQLDHYPDAKVILSLRNPESWAQSVHETIFSPLMRKITDGSPAREFFETTVYGAFGDRIDDLDFLAEYFQRWNEGVIAEVPKDRLLVFEARDGWEPLCDFLGVPVPQVPYPRVNSREELSQHMGEMDKQGGAMPADPEQIAAQTRAVIEQMRARAFGG